MTTAKHVVFGTGAIGLATFEALRRHGENVRPVNHGGASGAYAWVRSSVARRVRS